MQTIDVKPLSNDIHLICHACNTKPASHLCRFRNGGLIVQICLCDTCIKIDPGQLLIHTIGFREFETSPVTGIQQ